MMDQHQTALEQHLIIQANSQMEKIGVNLLASGRARTIQEAVQLACREHGQQIAGYLQASLRQLGAKDVVVTCP